MRTKSVFRNVVAKWAGTALLSILQLISRRIFIGYFSDELLGLSGVLNSVISMLSLLELGVGSAIYYSLYEPLEKDDKPKINAIMNLYRKIYTGIGIAVIAIGCVLFFFLNFFITTDLDSSIVNNAYFILLADTALSYFFAYRRNIFNADQNEYVCTNSDTTFGIFATLLQIALTVITGNYYLYLIGKIVGTIGSNVYIYVRSEIGYPYLRGKYDYKLSKEYLNEFVGNIKALCVANISTYLVFGTDNLLLSKFAGLGNVFRYSNYSLIINTVNKVFHNVFDSMRASVGNYLITNSKDDSYKLYNEIYFLNFWVTGFTSIALAICFNDFISLWVGEQYAFSTVCVLVLVLNNYLRFIQSSTAVFRNAAGLYNPYWFNKYWSLVEGIVNMVFSLLFIYFFDDKALGVFLGTTVSTLFIFTFSSTYTLFKYYFGMDKVKDYSIRYLKYFGLTILYFSLCLILCKGVHGKSLILNLVEDMLIVAIVPNLFNLILFHKTREFKALFIRIKKRN